MYYEDYGLLVELDGRLGHTGMGRSVTCVGDNRATTDGLATLRYGKVDVFGTPCEVAQEVSANLTRLGWRGVPHHCERCRRAA